MGTYTERIVAFMAPGWSKRIDRAAKDAGMSRGDWLRGVLRRATEAAERKMRRGEG